MSDGGGRNESQMEEGLALASPPERHSAVAASARTGSSPLSRPGLPSPIRVVPWLLVRRLPFAVVAVFVVTTLCLMTFVATGGIKWQMVGWGILESLMLFSFVCFAKLLHMYASRGNAMRRRRHRMPRRVAEARLQLNHPGIELGRLRLLLVDRDFTGEDYQALLDLDENNEIPSTAGASEGEIRRNPSFLVCEPPPDSVVKPKNCSICLYPFKARERVRTIPCLHQFHTECIDPWLRQKAICPVCKFPVVG